MLMWKMIQSKTMTDKFIMRGINMKNSNTSASIACGNITLINDIHYISEFILDHLICQRKYLQIFI